MIHLQDNYYLHADKYQFILKRKGVTGEKSERPGAEKYDDLGYYATIGQAVHAIGELKLKAAINNPVNTIQDVLREVEDWANSLESDLLPRLRDLVRAA